MLISVVGRGRVERSSVDAHATKRTQYARAHKSLQRNERFNQGGNTRGHLNARKPTQYSLGQFYSHAYVNTRDT